MNGKVEAAKVCILFGNLPCIKDSLKYDGIYAFQEMATLAKPGPWRDLFLELKHMDEETYRKIEPHTFFQVLGETVPALCDLLKRKAQKMREYAEQLGSF